MKLEIKKADVLKRMSAPQIGRALNITRHAVYQWGELVPEASAFKLLKVDPKIPHRYVA